MMTASSLLEREESNTLGLLASRSTELLSPPLTYIGRFIDSLKDLWDEDNQDGYISLSVAENKLSNENMLQRFLLSKSPSPSILNYDNTFGTEAMRQSMSNMMKRTFIRSPKNLFDQNDLVISSGCAAIINNAFYLLCDEGQGVLIPAPYYPAFDNDLKVKCGLVPFPCYLDYTKDIKRQLTCAKEAAAAEGILIRSILVTNPNNPLGFVYSKENLVDMIAWSLDNGIHYVSDEIYALSVFDSGVDFVSALCIGEELVQAGVTTEEQARNLLHILYGLSKDWSASGLRVGIMISRNKTLQRAMSRLALLSNVSNTTQHALSEIVDDEAWVDAFITENKRKLKESYEAVVEALRASNISFCPASAGLFVMIKLQEFLHEESFEAESELLETLFTEAKVLLTPGQACHAREPGYFRMCYAWVPKAAAVQAVHRIGRVLRQPKKHRIASEQCK